MDFSLRESHLEKTNWAPELHQTLTLWHVSIWRPKSYKSSSYSHWG